MEILKQIGLKKRESEVYKLLLTMGESPVSSIIKATKAHPQIVYRTIDSLIDKKLVISVRKKNKIYVSAENPKQLERIEEEKLYKLRQAVPDLIAMQKPSKGAIVRVSRGDEAVRSLRARGIDELKHGGTYYVIGGSDNRYYQVMGKFHEELERRRLKKKIHRKTVFFENQRKLNPEEGFKALKEFRYLPDEHYVTASTNIFNNTVAILIWTADPIVIDIESEEVAENYKKYFHSLWHMARP